MLRPFPCPHCLQPGVSAATKLFLGPGRTVACTACARPVSVPWWTMVFPVGPSLVLMAALSWLLRDLARRPLPEVPGLLVPTDVAVRLAVLGAAMIGLSVHWLWRVPLERR